MRIHETAIITGVEYGTIHTTPGRTLRAIRVEPGPWLWVGETPASDELSNDPIGEYWEEVISDLETEFSNIEEAEDIAVVDEDANSWWHPAMGNARGMLEGMVWEFTGWTDTLAMLRQWASEAQAAQEVAREG